LLKIILTGLYLLHSAHAYNSPILTQAFKLYKQGHYQQSLESLKNVKGNSEILGTRFYLEGVIQNKLQNYQEAILALNKARKRANKAEDLSYQLGQAYYANNDLEKAQRSFQSSFDGQYKAPESLYYVAHIAQLLEKYKMAKIKYKQITKLKQSPASLKQISYFQLGESLLSMAEEKKENTHLIKKFVLPSMRKAAKLLPKSSMVGEIEKRIKEIEKQYGLDPNVMKNGKILPKTRYKFSFGHEVKYDNNITLSTDLPTSQATQKDSFIHTTSLSGNYLFSFKNRHTSKPSLKLKNVYHTNRDDSTVFQNDSATYTPKIENTYEHMLKGKQASFLYDLEYSYISRDHQGIKNREYYSRALTFGIGEKFNYFSLGASTIKLKYKNYSGHQDSLNNKTKTISMDQTIVTKSGKLWILFFQTDIIDVYNNVTDSTNNFLFRTDFLWPEFYPKYLLNTALAVSFLDTKLQKATRGTEKTINPSIKMTKSINKKLSMVIAYEFTKNISKQTDSFSYTKHVTSMEIKYKF
jgi:tetratricopeptide (TPR) repeat protein